jgi:hypothetical protein
LAAWSSHITATVTVRDFSSAINSAESPNTRTTTKVMKEFMDFVKAYRVVYRRLGSGASEKVKK